MGKEIIPQRFKCCYGKKRPFKYICEQMLVGQQRYFRMFSYVGYSCKTTQKIINELQRIDEYKMNNINLETDEIISKN